MIKRITIKNFRSLKDVTVDLENVNLFIGPNNSGKSNFFKALEFLSDFRLEQEHLFDTEFYNYCFNKVEPKVKAKGAPPIEITVISEGDRKTYCYTLVLFKLNKTYLESQYCEFWGVLADNNLTNSSSFDFFDFRNLTEIFVDFKLRSSNIRLQEFKGIENRRILFGDNVGNNFSVFNHVGRVSIISDSQTPIHFDSEGSVKDIFDDSVINILDNFTINAPDPELMKLPYVFTLRRAKHDHELDGDIGNFVGFIERMRDDNPEVPQKIVDSFRQYFPDTERIVLSLQNPKVSRKEAQEQTNYIAKKFGLLNDKGITYWSDELSDGVLYFLALLAIIHQPNPPKLIMLEEPEKGIHPRRIHEVIDYIFQLAESKGIQVILSSHSTYVVDEFKDIPEAVFVFDKEGAETKIKNLQRDVIEPSHAKSEETGTPKINYTRSLGTHWAVGFIGGVPE